MEHETDKPCDVYACWDCVIRNGILSMFSEPFVDWINEKLENLNEGKR